MINLFLYDNNTKQVVINEPDVLLIKEFQDLWTNDRNKTENDKTGVKRTRAFRELSYIYLAIDWRSPYNQYTPQERHEAALYDSDLTQEEFDDRTFRAACRKYQDLQNSSRIGTLLQSQYSIVDKMKIYFESLNFDERDEQGKPIFKMKDVIAEIANTSKVLEGIRTLEQLYKKEQEEEKQLRGDTEKGFFD